VPEEYVHMTFGEFVELDDKTILSIIHDHDEAIRACVDIIINRVNNIVAEGAKDAPASALESIPSFGLGALLGEGVRKLTSGVQTKKVAFMDAADLSLQHVEEFKKILEKVQMNDEELDHVLETLQTYPMPVQDLIRNYTADYIRRVGPVTIHDELKSVYDP